MVIKKLTSSKLSTALISVLADDKIRERARILGEKVRAENGVENAIKNIYRDLEFSRLNILRYKNLQ